MRRQPDSSVRNKDGQPVRVQRHLDDKITVLPRSIRMPHDVRRRLRQGQAHTRDQLVPETQRGQMASHQPTGLGDALRCRGKTNDLPTPSDVSSRLEDSSPRTRFRNLVAHRDRPVRGFVRGYSGKVTPNNDGRPVATTPNPPSPPAPVPAPPPVAPPDPAPPSSPEPASPVPEPDPQPPEPDTGPDVPTPPA